MQDEEAAEALGAEGREQRKGRERGRWSEDGFEAFGGYMAAKISKLEGQFRDNADAEEAESAIFNGISIFVDGYTDPSSDELKRIMMLHGGTFNHYFSSRKTTHIIATNLPDVKVKALKGSEAICHPNWIVDSLKAGKLLDFRNYLLFSSVNSNQSKINFKPADQLQDRASSEATSKSASSHSALNANHERFLGEYYSNSRLHHISTMGDRFKRYINELRDRHGGKDFEERQKLREIASLDFSPVKGKLIMHIDMDCFFVSVGLRKHPELVGLPVAVAHAKSGSRRPNLPDSSASELASCSYEARAKGVKNGMFLGAALKLCPELKTISYDFEDYMEVARALYDTVAQFTLAIQAVSCDEMMVDITELISACSIHPLEFAEYLRNVIFDKTNCRASVGIGPNLLLARLATRKAKPDGKFYLKNSAAVAEFMADVAVSDLPGVGRATADNLKDIGAITCGELQGIPLHTLQKELGQKVGQTLFNFCRGIDEREVKVCQERKSVSAEVNYGIRFGDQSDCDRFIDQLCQEVQSRLEGLGLCGKSVTLKIMVRQSGAPTETFKFMGHGRCDSFSKSVLLPRPVSDANVIGKKVKLLMEQLNPKPQDLRGIGIQVTKLQSAAAATKSILGFINKSERSVATVSTSKERAWAERQKRKSKESGIDAAQIDPGVLEQLSESIRKELEENFDPNNGNIPEDCHNAGDLEDVEAEDGSSSESESEEEALARWQLLEELRQEAEVRAEEEALLSALHVRVARQKDPPSEREVSSMVEMLHNAVANKGLDRVSLVLRTLCSRVDAAKTCVDAWAEAYAFVVRQVEEATMEYYGYKLTTRTPKVIAKREVREK